MTRISSSGAARTAPATDRASPLRYRDFRLLWAGFFLSQVGTQMQVVAVAWQVYRLTGDPLALGAIGLARVLPVLVLGIFGGLFADVVDRRRMLLLTQSAMMACSFGLFYLTHLDRVTMPALYGFCFAAGVSTALGNPARQSLIPTLVPEAVLSRALGLSVSSWQLATVLGPTLGGILIASHGAAIVYLIDALSFLAMIVALLAIRARGSAAPDTVPGLEALREGFRFLWRTPVLLGLMVADFLGTFFAGAMLLMPIFADELLRVGPRGLGFLFAAPALGSMLVALAIALYGAPPLTGATVLCCIALYGSAVAAFGATGSFELALLFLVVAGAADGASTVVRQTLRQLLTPDHLRGRMTGVTMVFFMGGPQLGEIEAGALARLVGVRASVVAGGVLCALSAAAMALAVPSLRRFRLHETRRTG
ncbi:MAG: MFS transporter [Thermodesulfobacteriota bacterium]